MEYGQVHTGTARVVTLQLHNPKAVPAEWGVSQPLEASKTKDWNFFRLEPSEGVLPPGERLNVRVIFTPVMGRKVSTWCK